jgi:hypothetical protein
MMTKTLYPYRDRQSITQTPQGIISSEKGAVSKKDSFLR